MHPYKTLRHEYHEFRLSLRFRGFMEDSNYYCITFPKSVFLLSSFVVLRIINLSMAIFILDLDNCNSTLIFLSQGCRLDIQHSYIGTHFIHRLHFHPGPNDGRTGQMPTTKFHHGINWK